MQAYINYFEGKLVDQDYDEKELAMALAGPAERRCLIVPDRLFITEI